ncbi:DUF4870 domain-containing protein [Coriobacteriia bacterium Es71-Z0120]|uniref:DUF4870 domain-containing protein n=1 Tax=Parvivirga hydrogeniphila TaxID=2939460 RepID=UPI002260F1C1|nr:DUF4870 domain-containing protein [Parvivirga hydrogeniphila]MCL4079498.1 DUF4870 domain-containing protein [Parvivirga hydrogeniphila]
MSDEVNQVPGPSAEGRPGPESDTSKILAVLGYLTGIVAIIAILIEPYKNEKWLRLHAVQALGLAVVGIVAQIVLAIPVIGWIAGPLVSLAVLVFAILGIIKAWQGEYYEMPVIYDLVKQFV